MTTASEDTAFAARLSKVDAKMAAVTDLAARFEQLKKTAMLKKPLRSKGTVACKGDRVLWTTDSPRPSRMLVADGKVTVYYPADKLAEVYPMGERFREVAGGPLPRLSKLRENFELTPAGPDDFGVVGDQKVPPDRLAIKLTPKTQELAKHIASVRVLIDESVPCADCILIEDPEGDITEVRFTAVKVNSGLAADRVDLQLPADTKVSQPAGSSK
jgi:outer membrane lipoprotein-sorting protein